jgi:AcrR family transcriptional regulator
MRVSAETKEATRRRILAAAQAMFTRNGYEATRTHDISEAAGVATGTLFNYFPTKEAIATAIVAEALGQAHRQLEKGRRRRDASKSLEEQLFTLIATELRCLRPHRSYLAPVLETLSPLARGASGSAGEMLRAGHMQQVEHLFAALRSPEPPSFVARHLYWTLYAGVLAFWTKDSSRNQEDTLAVLDCSLKAFVGSLPSDELSPSDSRRRN